jgi:hypothetical protein
MINVAYRQKFDDSLRFIFMLLKSTQQKKRADDNSPFLVNIRHLNIRLIYDTQMLHRNICYLKTEAIN